MTAPHLPADVTPESRGVVVLNHDVGVRHGHLLRLLSLECWNGWADLRFARIDIEGAFRLTRRVPPPTAWQIAINGEAVTVFDAVGRGDRAFSNGEVRIVPDPPDGAMMTVKVDLVGDGEPLSTTVTLHHSR